MFQFRLFMGCCPLQGVYILSCVPSWACVLQEYPCSSMLLTGHITSFGKEHLLPRVHFRHVSSNVPFHMPLSFFVCPPLSSLNYLFLFPLMCGLMYILPQCLPPFLYTYLSDGIMFSSDRLMFWCLLGQPVSLVSFGF